MHRAGTFQSRGRRAVRRRGQWAVGRAEKHLVGPPGAYQPGGQLDGGRHAGDFRAEAVHHHALFLLHVQAEGDRLGERRDVEVHRHMHVRAVRHRHLHPVGPREVDRHPHAGDIVGIGVVVAPFPEIVRDLGRVHGIVAVGEVEGGQAAAHVGGVARRVLQLRLLVQRGGVPGEGCEIVFPAPRPKGVVARGPGGVGERLPLAPGREHHARVAFLQGRGAVFVAEEVHGPHGHHAHAVGAEAGVLLRPVVAEVQVSPMGMRGVAEVHLRAGGKQPPGQHHARHGMAYHRPYRVTSSHTRPSFPSHFKGGAVCS